MNKIVKYLLIALVAIFLLMQLLGPSAPETSVENLDDLLAVEQIDAGLADILRTSCYDCHSMETSFPLYDRIAPVSWWVYGHVNHGREELNFSNWNSLRKSKKISKLKDITEVLEEGKMPLGAYVSMHPKAKLTDAQRARLVDWAKTFAQDVMDRGK